MEEQILRGFLAKMIGDIWEDFHKHNLTNITLNRMFLDDELVEMYCEMTGFCQNQMKESYDLLISQRFMLEEVELRKEEIKENAKHYLDLFKKTGKMYI